MKNPSQWCELHLDSQMSGAERHLVGNRTEARGSGQWLEVLARPLLITSPPKRDHILIGMCVPRIQKCPGL